MRRFLQSFAVVIWAALFALLPLRAEKLWKTLPAPLPLPAPTETGEAPVILPGLSHFAMLQDPKAFNQAVLEFLK